MADIGYLDAWAMWLSRDPALRDAHLIGLSMEWWGRLGKIGAFLGGMTVVLDILGPERIREYGGRIRRLPRSPAKGVLAAAATAGVALLTSLVGMAADIATGPFGGRVALVGLVLLVILAVVWIALAAARAKLFESALNGIAWILEHPRSLEWWRGLSLLLLIAGFHFDLLAS
ncbi:hypothetical protein JOL79_16710 [Microbispora sp. RL4-1S]|uniref:Uncharacterized protein n=1 Tax=Microbispora oryzae TaxID=2806554 RepID=A0A940WGV9_9ACTN|nr:hypothetical protein [Microbispora oryzae]MBP2705454.1 hypothetical protein [Microbispora oryzae]